MTSLSKDARYFVDGVTKHLRVAGGGNIMIPKMTAILHKISSSTGTAETAIVESTVVLTAREKADIIRFLSRLLTHTVTLECNINKGLIGGIRVVVGDWVVDTSLASQIREMQEQLTK